MPKIKFIIKNVALYVSVVVLGGFTLLASAGAAYADDSASCDPTPHPDSYYGAGVHHPVGTDASTYTYDCNTDTYSNGYYTYYPATATKVANFDRNYSYDCTTNVWTMDDWGYSPASGSFTKYRAVTSSPGLATNCPPPTPSNSTTGTAPGANGTSISGTGSGSTNSSTSGTTLNNTTTNTNNLNANNILVSTSGTGNASVTGNTIGGSAGTGDAQSVANIANLLQSTSNVFGPGTATFTANINGDVNGDFMFDPSAIMGTGTNSNNSTSNNLDVNTQNTNTTNAQLTNNIDVGATSGNATVSGNTKAGDATSGNAQAVVNLMNLINSTVAAGQSFVGTININGSLNGDILLPQGVMDQLLASTGSDSTNSLNNQYTDNSNTTSTTNQQVTNNVTNSALTGNATVSGNTTGGSANSGTAHTGVTLLNLTGSNTIGKNSLLVFVNVLGKWVGMIMNAPTGTTAAQLGGGITKQTGSGSTNTSSNSVTDNSKTTSTSNLGITNNVNVHAQSGDATVADNTVGGNAKSGNASTAVNVLNLMGSNISLSDWFGVLFINVFGMWNGSFGVNTSAGDPAANPSNNPVQAANQQAMINSLHQFASFSPGPGSGSTSKTSSDGAVLGEATAASIQKVATTATNASTPVTSATKHANLLMPAIGVGLAFLILVASERSRFVGKKN